MPAQAGSGPILWQRVLEPNYRGSAGYGETSRSLNVRNLGIGDAWDVLSGIDGVASQFTRGKLTRRVVRQSGELIPIQDPRALSQG
jgi:hypothetical protein